MKLKPWQERVVTEQKELAEKLKRLSDFTFTPTFKALPKPEQERLNRQCSIMGQYNRVLGERISAFVVGGPESDF